jgi:hypothetical protein
MLERLRNHRKLIRLDSVSRAQALTPDSSTDFDGCKWRLIVGFECRIIPIGGRRHVLPCAPQPLARGTGVPRVPGLIPAPWKEVMTMRVMCSWPMPVSVTDYFRFRLGQWEYVRSHCRSWPQR